MAIKFKQAEAKNEVPIRVLSVDDNELVLKASTKTIEAIARKVGFLIKTTKLTDGINVIDHIEDSIQEKHPHLVVTDIEMANMDGLTLAKILVHKYPHIFLIILSGNSTALRQAKQLKEDHTQIQGVFQKGGLEESDEFNTCLLSTLEQIKKALPDLAEAPTTKIIPTAEAETAEIITPQSNRTPLEAPEEMAS